MHDLTKDVTISRVEMNALVTAILDRFAITMRKTRLQSTSRSPTKPARCKSAPTFRPRGSSARNCRKSLWRMMAARRGSACIFAQKTKSGYKGKIGIGTSRDDFRFPIEYFLRGQHALSAQVVEALNSGIFEGEIVSQLAVMNPDRKSFKIDDVVRLGLCLAIEEWFERHGTKHFKEAKDERRDERYQLLGLRSLCFLSIAPQQSHADGRH